MHVCASEEERSQECGLRLENTERSGEEQNEESVETVSQRFHHLLGASIPLSHMTVLDCLLLPLLEVSSRVDRLPPSPKSTQHWEMG